MGRMPALVWGEGVSSPSAQPRTPWAEGAGPSHPTPSRTVKPAPHVHHYQGHKNPISSSMRANVIGPFSIIFIIMQWLIKPLFIARLKESFFVFFFLTHPKSLPWHACKTSVHYRGVFTWRTPTRTTSNAPTSSTNISLTLPHRE